MVNRYANGYQDRLDEVPNSDPDYLDTRNGLIIIVLGNNRNLLDNCCGSHKRVKDWDSATIDAQGSGNPGKLT